MQSSRPPESIKIIGNLQYDRENRIGEGGYCSVFRGTFNGENVAVKRVLLIDVNDVKNRELENNEKLSRLNPPNIVQFKHYEEDEFFR